LDIHAIHTIRASQNINKYDEMGEGRPLVQLKHVILQIINIRAPLNVHMPAYLYDGLHM